MSKFLSVEWFKNKIESSVEKVIANKINNIINQIDAEEELIPENNPVENINIVYDIIPVEKLYKNIMLVNDILTVVFQDGTIKTKSNATEIDYNAIVDANSLEEIMNVISSPEIIAERKVREVEMGKIKVLQAGISTLKDLDDFIVEDDIVYMKGIKRSIPQLLVEKFIQVIEDIKYYKGFGFSQEELNNNIEYQSLKKFWLKCCLNPNAQSAEDLYKFLAKHQFKIDKHGNFYAYRRVVSLKSENKELIEFIEFISNAYTKVKAIWKKKSIDFFVWQKDDGSFYFSKNDLSKSDGINKFYGNLEELYLNLPNMQENNYTSSHTGEEDYRIGNIISMERNNGDDNNNISCSRGYHAASKAYNYSNFGDTPILVIINPMDVLAVPHNEDGKLRTCRWFFATTLSKSEEHILDYEEYDVSELGNIFEEKCLLNLENYVQNSFAEEVQRHTFTLPGITNKELHGIVVSLEEMQKEITNRVNLI